MTTRAVSFSHWPSLELDDRALGFLKWSALMLMVIDHINTHLLGGSQAWMFAAGRFAMPLFTFVLGYNLGRPGGLELGSYRRASQRLALFGLLAMPPFMMLNKFPMGWWPLNMMFGLLVAVVAVWLFERGGRWNFVTACLVIAVGGALVEFWWPAVGLCLSVWVYRRRPSLEPVAALVACLLALCLVNGTFWTLAVLPVLVLSRFWSVELPRAPWFFYAFYPLHLWGLWAYLTWVR